MADNAGNSSEERGAFHRLPPEILTMIVSSFTENGQRSGSPKDYHTLKSLRLTHRNFARLGEINDALFSSIRMQTTVSSLQSMQYGDLSQISDHVRKIVFVAPLSWAMMFETFTEIVNYGPIMAHAQRLRDQGLPCDYHVYEDTQDAFVQKYMGGKWPFSKDQLQKSFGTYMQMAKVTQDLFRESNHMIDKAWVKVLGSLGSRPRKVHLHTRRCHSMQTLYFSELETSTSLHIGPHQHADPSGNYACSSASTVVGDALFAKAVSCISMSGLQVSHLNIGLQMVHGFDPVGIPKWEQLDLSELKTLEYSVAALPRFHPSLRVEFKKSVLMTFPILRDEKCPEKRACLTLDLLMRKARASLQRLDIDPSQALSWPVCEASYDLPALEFVICRPGWIEPTLLASWVARMPQLRHLKLDGDLTEGVKYERWIDLFDAIRDHPNVIGSDTPGMFISFNNTSANRGLDYEGTVHRKMKVESNEVSVMTEDLDEEYPDVDEATEEYLIYGESSRLHRALRIMQEELDENETTGENTEEEDDEEEEEEDASDQNSDGDEYEIELTN